MKYKDPTTGEFKELKIRATDELPVGSEIDVDDNTTIPAGWEQTDDVIESGTGYVVIGDTLIIWGVKTASATASNSTDITITFPKNFANTNYSFVVTKSKVGNSTALYPTISTKSVNQCVLNVFNSHSGAINNNYNYMIIGKVATD